MGAAVGDRLGGVTIALQLEPTHVRERGLQQIRLLLFYLQRALTTKLNHICSSTTDHTWKASTPYSASQVHARN